MARPYLLTAYILWIGWIVTWNVAALWRDRRTRRASRGSYSLQLGVAMLGFIALFAEVPLALRHQWWVHPLWSVGPTAGILLDAVIGVAILFAWWARIEMGRLWSGGIERTEDHRVIDTGPFRLVRHPIYTGLIAGGIGLALIKATPLAFAGAVLIALGFGLKAKVEERFLEREIGGYTAYRRRVPMLVPGLRQG